MNGQHSYHPQYDPRREFQAQSFEPKTAIHELDSFMSGLTAEDRNIIFSNPDFAEPYGAYLNRFMFYLLQGDLGTAYVNSSAQRREIAERLKLVAHDVYAANKKTTMSEMDRLQKENERLQAELNKKGTK